MTLLLTGSYGPYILPHEHHTWERLVLSLPKGAASVFTVSGGELYLIDRSAGQDTNGELRHWMHSTPETTNDLQDLRYHR